MSSPSYDVLIIGGGPAGSTAASLLKKYNPGLRVLVLERETFPREHVGESQLPPISKILDEMGCWDKVEAANFPIKVGATYRWGTSDDLWDFEFLPLDTFKDEARPAKYEGQRVQTAFQVDRAIYDTILLDHAAELGAEVRQNTKVAKIHKDGDRVTGVELSDGSRIEAKYYLDASGNSGILRRAMGIATEAPTKLRNVAMWDYWDNAEWSVSIGTGGTRVLVLSIDVGWIWFIPLGPTRTSIGFICPADHYKKMEMTTEELYLSALEKQPLVKELTAKATRDGKVQATKDWSFLADRLVGENWFLIGESCGFADPILAAGMTLAHGGAREAAYTILELERGELDGEALKSHYCETQRTRITQHIRFADFWYSANKQFTDLQEYTTEIAKDAGLRLDPQQAFQWLGTGGFTGDVAGQAGLGGLDLGGVKQITGMFTDGTVGWSLSKYNKFKLNLKRAREDVVFSYKDGRIETQKCWKRGQKTLLDSGLYALLIQVLQQHQDIATIAQALMQYLTKTKAAATPELGLQLALQSLEVMLLEGWVTGKLDKKKPRLNLNSPLEGQMIHKNKDLADKL
ncbi:NAD(P)/FAD-dependent oxidoreductase [Paremcibacter congregatus]|uniref:NAD(P)/FAD-dependent oxidoreductase n=1 Tax=Paremcibacter congregatus TaxID=2043170 RepID=UPI0013FE10AA|nr:NAD(P)/FAD-dependent oxidoreductase [Paremcibacter congregatus]